MHHGHDDAFLGQTRDEMFFGWKRECVDWISLQWCGWHWIMWANGWIKQTKIWLNWKINSGQSASKYPAILPLPASAIQHVWKKARGSSLSWAKTTSEKKNCNCISSERDVGSFVMVAQLNSDLDENEKRQRSNCSCKAAGQTCQETPSWNEELGTTVQKPNKNSEPAIVCNRDAKNKLLSFPQVDCKEQK